MTVRLGFAIAAHLEPEILVVDEVLAVGDAEFQKKAIGKMQDVSRGEGRTVLFVSHNMGAVKNLCKRGIVLNQGQVAFDGEVDEAIGYYTKSSNPISSKKIVDHIEWKKSFINVTSIKINGSEEPQTIIEETQPYLSIEISGTLTEPIVCGICLKFKNEQNVTLATFAEHGYKGNHISLAIGQFSLRQKISLPKYLCRGEYFIDLLLNQARTQEYFFAPHCCSIFIKGRADQFGNPLTSKNDGFLGLESCEV
jgi:lipopolysaccharide transport system ATP-binding protein